MKFRLSVFSPMSDEEFESFESETRTGVIDLYAQWLRDNHEMNRLKIRIMMLNAPV